MTEAPKRGTKVAPPPEPLVVEIVVVRRGAKMLGEPRDERDERDRD